MCTIQNHGIPPICTPKTSHRFLNSQRIAGFHGRKSTTDQVTILCQDVEDSFQAGKKAGAVFLRLTATYDTVWLRGLHMKVLETMPDKHMVEFVMEMLSNRSFQLHTSNSQHSRLRYLKNGVPQGALLASLLFISTSITFPQPC